jgi:anti-anti-sigma factor
MEVPGESLMAMKLARLHTTEGVPRGVAVVHFTGCRVSLDQDTMLRIRDDLLALAGESSDSDLLLDFENVVYVSSTALGTLVGLHQRLLRRGRQLIIANVGRQVCEVLAVTRLDKYLHLRLPEQRAGPVALDGPARFSSGCLVVDDEAAVAGVLAAVLRMEGFKVWLAADGQRGIELYKCHRKDIAVVLLDVLMPGMDGPQTLTALRKLSPTVRCCFMTGNPSHYGEQGLLQMGALRVFRKPFVFAEVIDTLRQLAGAWPHRQQERWIEIPSRGV